MSQTDPYLVIGGGLAGAKAAEALRQAGYAGPLTILAAEDHLPYERPGLSKGFLLGRDEQDSLLVHPEQWYAEHDVELRRGTRVVELDPAGHVVVTESGEQLPYAKLLLATGSSPRRLSLPGADLAGVHYLRTLEDSNALKETFGAGRRVVVIGAGWVGLETAAAARTNGAEVTVLEYAAQPLLNVLGPELGAAFAELHRSHGVDVRCGVSVAELRAGDQPGRVASVVLADGSELPADAVVVGVGVAPNDELARGAGLTVDNGIVVDESLRTSDPDVFAVGDVANAYHPRLDRQLRVEHWATALRQPEVVAKAMLGEAAAYDADPYFFTDQYDLGMEYFGYVGPGDDAQLVIRGDLASLKFIAFWLVGGRLRAAMQVNDWDASETVKALVRHGAEVDGARLGDASVPLADLLP